VLGLCYIANNQKDPYPENTLGEFPLFTNLNREKLLVKLKLPNTGSVNKRIISGVALFLTDA